MEIIGPFIGTTLIFLIVFGFAAYVRFLDHKETLALAEKGLVRSKGRRNGNGKGALRWGIIIAAVGLALIIGIVPSALRWDWAILLVGLLPTFFGLGLILIYVLTDENSEQPKVSELPTITPETEVIEGDKADEA